MPKKAIALLFLTIAVSSCTFLPVPLAYLNYARNGYDVTQIAEDEPTTTDNVLSAVTNMNCQIFNVLDGDNVCKEKTKEWIP
jgi:hypothetical protein